MSLGRGRTLLANSCRRASKRAALMVQTCSALTARTLAYICSAVRARNTTHTAELEPAVTSSSASVYKLEGMKGKIAFHRE